MKRHSFFDEGVPFVSAEAVSSERIDFSKVRAAISQEDNANYSLKESLNNEPTLSARVYRQNF